MSPGLNFVLEKKLGCGCRKKGGDFVVGVHVDVFLVCRSSGVVKLFFFLYISSPERLCLYF